MDYMTKIDEILNVVGVRTKEHAAERTGESLKQWVNIQKSRSSGSSIRGSQNSSVQGSGSTTPNPSPMHQPKEQGTPSDMTGTTHSEEYTTKRINHDADQVEDAMEALSVLDGDPSVYQMASELAESAVDSAVNEIANHKPECSSLNCDTQSDKHISDQPDSSRVKNSHLLAAGVGNSGTNSVTTCASIPENSHHEEGEADTGEGLLDTAPSDVTTPDSGIFLAPSTNQGSATTPDSGID